MVQSRAGPATKWDVRGGRAPTFGPLPTLTCEFYLANGTALASTKFVRTSFRAVRVTWGRKWYVQSGLSVPEENL